MKNYDDVEGKFTQLRQATAELVTSLSNIDAQTQEELDLVEAAIGEVNRSTAYVNMGRDSFKIAVAKSEAEEKKHL